MKFLLISILLVSLARPTFSQSQKEQEFSAALTRIVKALSTRDSAQLSNYIHPGTGVYIIYRPGVMDTYKHYTHLGFSDSTYPSLPFYDGVKLTPLVYAKLPSYDCEQWSKTGTFVDTTKTDRLLSKTAKIMNRELGKEVSKAKVAELTKLEERSRRVVIAENEGNELIIYLSLIGGKWYLTIIDKVTADCST